MNDYLFMSQALRLAEKGLWTTSPNPRVGCVIVKQGKVIGKGFHKKAGEPHAEIYALTEAGEAARGATAYITLEPCNHFGKTPPCTDALIKAGISKVVAAMEDPNPLVAGTGLQKLRTAGITVVTDVLKAEAIELNLGFVTRMQYGRPWIRSKLASSLDGKTALLNGKSQWITGDDARRDVHRLRARTCAMLTGIGTVLQDDPELNVRMFETTRQPARVVIDSQLRIPLSARILKNTGTIIVTLSDDKTKQRRLSDVGAEVICLPGIEGRVDLNALAKELGQRGFNEVTIEAGARLNGAMLKSGLIDEIILYQAPILLGHEAQGLFVLPEMQSLSEKIELKLYDVRKVGQDIRMTARVLRK